MTKSDIKFKCSSCIFLGIWHPKIFELFFVRFYPTFPADLQCLGPSDFAIKVTFCSLVTSHKYFFRGGRSYRHFYNLALPPPKKRYLSLRMKRESGVRDNLPHHRLVRLNCQPPS